MIVFYIHDEKVGFQRSSHISKIHWILLWKKFTEIRKKCTELIKKYQKILKHNWKLTRNSKKVVENLGKLGKRLTKRCWKFIKLIENEKKKSLKIIEGYVKFW